MSRCKFLNFLKQHFVISILTTIMLGSDNSFKKKFTLQFRSTLLLFFFPLYSHNQVFQSSSKQAVHLKTSQNSYLTNFCLKTLCIFPRFCFHTPTLAMGDTHFVPSLASKHYCVFLIFLLQLKVIGDIVALCLPVTKYHVLLFFQNTFLWENINLTRFWFDPKGEIFIFDNNNVK